VAFEVAAGSYTIQLGVEPDGRASFFAITGPTFSAFAGKGFEMEPPAITVEPGGSPVSGALTFADLPDLGEMASTLSGRISWRCPG
jgi:hypothetical protein